MKILLATYWAIPHLGGVWNYMKHLQKGLETEGHTVDLMGFNTNNRHVIVADKDIRIPITPFPQTELPPDQLIVTYTSHQSKEYEVAASTINLEVYDVIHVQDVIAAHAIHNLKLKHPILITSIHGCLTGEIEEQFFQDQSSTDARNLSYFRNLEFIGGTAGYTTIVANNWMKWILTNNIQIPEDQLTVLHYGFDGEEFFSKQQPPSRFFTKKKNPVLFIYTGRLIKTKGVHHLITALSYVKKQNKNWVCWIIGDGEELYALQKLTKELHLCNHVLFLGERNDIPSLLQEGDLFILPTLAENQPLSIIEAQLSGLPIIASAIGGIPEMIHDGVNGILTPAGDPVKLAEHISFLLTEDKIRKEMGEHAFAFAKDHWSLSTATTQILQLYHDAIQTKHH